MRYIKNFLQRAAFRLKQSCIWHVAGIRGRRVTEVWYHGVVYAWPLHLLSLTWLYADATGFLSETRSLWRCGNPLFFVFPYLICSS
jgi:hypothetical protein